jgi:hypothetical protein
MQEQPSFLERLRGLSHPAKSRILVGAVIVSALAFGSLWVNETRKNLVGMDNSTPLLNEGSVLSANNYITVESYEDRGGKRYVYFKVQNNTPEILNFSKKESIKFEIGKQSSTPESVTDRQQSSFVTKVLSNTTIYGTLVFNGTDGTKGKITFDEMFFENQPNNIFRETLEVDLNKLKPVEELRS